MVKSSTVIMAGVTFTGGLLLGLILHLPGASSPSSIDKPSVDLVLPPAAIQNNDLSLNTYTAGASRTLLSDTNSKDNYIQNKHNKHHGKGHHLKQHLKMNNSASPGRRHIRIRGHKRDGRLHSEQVALKESTDKGIHTFTKQTWHHSNHNSERERAHHQNAASPVLTRPRSSQPHVSLKYANEGTFENRHNINSPRSGARGNDVDSYREEIDLQKPEPQGIHKVADWGDKLPNTPHVEMSVRVVDVATGRKHLKNPADIIGPDRQVVLPVSPESLPVTSDQVSTNTPHQRFTQLAQILDGIFWSPQLEHMTPKGFSETQTTKWRRHARDVEVSEIKEGCGRMQNRLVVFRDGVKMCARYRINNDQIQGEVFSYYLAKALGIDNVLPPILAKTDPSTSQWKSVSGAIDAAQWDAQKLFVLTPWLGKLLPAYIPEEFHGRKHPILTPVSQTLVNKTIGQLTELVQWSDLIILDYLTGNVDRVVNNMFNLQWNSGMMQAPTHNLERMGSTDLLVFLDNESGLLHSYRLLEKYHHYHERLLKSICIFKHSTVEKIRQLVQNGDIAQRIRTLFRTAEPLSGSLSFIPHHNLSVLSQRLVHIKKHIDWCEKLYANST